MGFNNPMRILFASPNLEIQPVSGGVQRTFLLLKQLRKWGEVDRVFFPPQEPTLDVRAEMQSMPGRLWIIPTATISKSSNGPVTSWFSAGRWRWQPCRQSMDLVGDLTRYDLVVSRYLSPACILDLFRHPRLLVDVDDYDPDRLALRLKTSSWVKRLTLNRALKFSWIAHSQRLPLASHSWVSNPLDRSHSGLAAATLLPNVPYFTDSLPWPLPAPPCDQAPVFLVVGTLDYSANSDGIDAFLDEAWPTIRAEVPTAELHIVGKGLSPAQRTRWASSPGVSTIGFVESLAVVYARCTATLAPILAGGGTNIKVLESCAYARPCVVSRIAHRGFEETLPAGEACLFSETIAGMADACLQLLRTPGLAARIGLRARAAIEIHYSADVFASAVNAGIERVMAPSTVST